VVILHLIVSPHPQTYTKISQGTKAGAEFPGSMGPKIQAAINFVEGSAANKPDAFAVIGDLRDAGDLLSNLQGTTIRRDGVGGGGVEWRTSRSDSSSS
jgi:carbamate kinase